MILGSAANLLGIVCYASARDPMLLMTGAAFHGLSAALFSGNQDALLHDILFVHGEEKEFAHHHGRLRAMFQIGLGLAAIVGGFLGEISLRWVFWASVLPTLISLSLAMCMSTIPKHNAGQENIFAHLGEALRKFRENWKLRTLSLSSIFTFGVGEATFQFEPAFTAMFWPTWGLGLARFSNHIFAALSSWYAGSVIRRFSEKTILLSTEIISRTVGLITFGFPTPFSPAILSLMSCMYGIRSVSLDTLLQREFTHQQRATMGSLNAFAGNILFAFVALGLGAIADRSSPITAMVVGQFLMMPIIYWYAKLFRDA